MMELNEETRFILGRPNFVCGGIAPLLRIMGYKIPKKSEEEQAAVIHWMLCLYEKHGDGWIEFLIDNWYYYEVLLYFLLYTLGAGLFCLRMDTRSQEANDEM